MDAATAWIALGSNLGDRRATLDAAVRGLAAEEGVEVLRVSPWLETEPVGGPPGQGPYLNGVLEARTTLSPRGLLERLLALEVRHGRLRAEEIPDGPRTLDLDLLLLGDTEVSEPDLVVPHPRLEERTFVLEPFARLAPDHRLARSGLTVRERLESLRARSERTAETA
jgi:2-amino-4-hydroxy-6-hydroxymethyldihydropteridine diphosphokinase